MGMMSTDQLTEAAIALPEAQRRELVRVLLDSLPPEEEAFDPEFMQELLRRDEEMDSGRVKGHTHEEVMAMARKVLECD